MAGYALGTARGIIELIYRGGGGQAAQNDLDKTRAAAGNVGKGMMGAGAAIAGGFALAIGKAASFEKQISAIGAVSGASGDQMEQLRGKALQLGASTSFSASEAATAMEELVKAGIPIPDVLNGAADATVALAAAGEIALPEAATIASNAMNQFKLSAQDMPHVADLFAGAANASAISVTDLGESMKYVGPVAAGLGVSIDDATAAVAILGQQGIKGSEAGTALRSVLSNLAPSTAPATAAFKKLGLITKDGTNLFYDAQGSLKPLAEVMDILNSKTKNLSDVEKNTFTKTAFGLNSMTSAGILAGTTGAKFEEMAANIAKVKAADVAKARLDNFTGSLDSLMGTIETVAIQIGSIFLPALTKTAQFLGNLIGKFTTLSPAAQKVIAIIGAVVAVLLLVGGAIVTAVASIGALTGIFTAGLAVLKAWRIYTLAAAAANAVFTASVLWPVVAIAAVIAILIIAYKRFEGFRNVVDTVGRAIKAGFVAAMNFLIPVLQRVGSFLMTVGRAVVTGLIAGFRAAIPVVMAVVGFLTGTLIPALVAVVGFIIRVGAAILGGFRSAFGVIGPLLAAVAGYIRAWGALVWAIIGLAFKVISTGIKIYIAIWTAIIRTGIAVITTVFRAGWAVFGPIIRAVMSVIVPIIRTAFNVIMTIIRTVMSVVGNVIRVGWSIISNVIRTVLSVIIRIITAAFNVAKTVIQTITQIIKAITEGRWSDILGIIRGALTKINAIIKSTFSAIWNVIKAAMSRIWAVIKSAFSNIWNSIKSAMSNIKNAVMNGFNQAKAAASRAISAMKSAVSSAFSAIVSKIRSSASSMLSSVRSAMSNIASAAKTGASKLLSAIKTGVSNAVAAVKALPGKVASGLGNLGGLLMDKGKDLIRGFIEGIKSMAGEAAAAAGNMAKDAAGAVASKLKIWSPSRVLMDMGNDTAKGFAIGIEKMGPKVEMAAEATAGLVPSAMTPAPSARARGASVPAASTAPGPLVGEMNIHAARGMSEAEIGRQTVTRMGASMLGRTVPIPAPAGGYK